jgi:hypothetical protein
MEVRERSLSTADLAGMSKAHEETDPKTRDKAERKPEAAPIGESRGEKATASAGDHDGLVALFSDAAIQDFRSQWTALQTGFVDEPRRSVKQADELVARVMHDLASTFSEERKKLEQQWEQGDKVSTEELRLVLRRYRSFFDRFLSI